MDKTKLAKLIEANSNITTETILQDIEDTRVEIEQLEREAKGLRLIGDRLSLMKADKRDLEIYARNDFIKTLSILLKERQKNI